MSVLWAIHFVVDLALAGSILLVYFVIGRSQTLKEASELFFKLFQAALIFATIGTITNFFDEPTWKSEIFHAGFLALFACVFNYHYFVIFKNKKK